jgi:histidinol-phosphate aminotransferase
MTSLTERLIRPEVLELARYHVADSAGMVKLDAMENPYDLPEPLRREIGELVSSVALNRYPDPGGKLLKRRLREMMAIPDDVEIMLGNGSDELIQIVAQAVNRPGAALLSVEPSFVMYRLIARAVGLKYIGALLTDGFEIDAERVLEAIEQHSPAAIFLAYPNNPTGNLFSRDAVERVIEKSPGLVVVDEAYHAFAGASFINELARYPNLLLMRTLSKLGLAGLRLGFLLARGEWIRELEKIRLPYNVNVLSQAVAERVLAHPDVLASQAQAIVREREGLTRELGRYRNVQVFPSAANFILFRTANSDAVFEGLKARKILIKNLNGSHPLLRDCLRVTVGTPKENRLFLAVLSDLLRT